MLHWRAHAARQPYARTHAAWPNFKPIEKAFSRLEAMLRKAGERSIFGLSSLAGTLVELFQPQECANYATCCGYDPE